MPANWSLIINVLLLIGVIITIGRVMKSRRQSMSFESYQLPPKTSESKSQDDIISVRKITPNPEIHPSVRESEKSVLPKLSAKKGEGLNSKHRSSNSHSSEPPKSLMMFLLAKDNRQFAGYDLLQTVLSSGMRFGEGQLFHRHQSKSGQGPVLFSLAAATSSGVFDMQNIGAFSAKGLCLFMHVSTNPSIDAERLSIMLESARQLSEGLDCYLLDDKRKPLNDERIAEYYHCLNLEPGLAEAAV